MGRDDADLVRDPKLVENVGRTLHHAQIRVAAHDDADERSGLGHSLDRSGPPAPGALRLASKR